MLVLARHIGERIIIQASDGEIIIELIEIGSRKAKVGITAPKSVKVLREELIEGAQNGQ